jgi:hypothetical protein
MPSEPVDHADTDKLPNSKVARLLDSYDLGDAFGDRLQRLWTAEGDHRMSLRDLADLLNERVLEAAMIDAGMRPIDGEVENFYRLLTDSEVSSGNRTEAKRELEQNGIDTEGLERDFVTYQAIRSYLQDYRGVTYQQQNDTGRAQDAIQTLQRLQSRTRSVSERNISQLESAGELSVGESRVSVNLSVFCTDCNTQYELRELVEAGSCECDEE